ncbi:MAG: MarR family transcriptional regulator [Rhodothermales bacterium]
MSTALQREIRQSKPFASPEAEAALNVARTAAILDAEIADALKPHGLTPTQYNVLRILRGAGDSGLCRYEVGDRLVTPVPDVTRLLDRLEAGGLVDRARDSEDRRQVRARITPQGLDLLGELDGVLEALHRRQLGHLGADRLRVLIDVLADARQRE